MKTITIIILAALSALAQSTPPGGGKVAAVIGPRGATLPATCVDGQLYQKISGGSEGTYSCVLGSWVAMGAGAVGTAGTGISIVGSTIAIDSTTTPQKNAAGTWTSTQTFGPAIGYTPGTAPATTEGFTYYDSTKKKIALHNGTAWLWQAYNPGTTTGDIFYCSDTATPCTLQRLASGASGRVLTAQGAGAAPSWDVSGSSTPTKLVDSNGADVVLTGATASAVNQVIVTNAAAGGKPSIAATGQDTSVTLRLAAKPTNGAYIEMGTTNLRFDGSFTIDTQGNGTLSTFTSGYSSSGGKFIAYGSSHARAGEATLLASGVEKASVKSTGLLVFDPTATTGVTGLTIKAGAGQSTTNLTEWQLNGGGVVAAVSPTGLAKATSLQLLTEAEPTCEAATRGRINYVAGGAGVADTVRVCVKSAADSYAWTALF
jgi:hypothetical protein